LAGYHDQLNSSEIKRIKLLNAICLSWYFIIIFFISLDFFLEPDFWTNVMGHIFQVCVLITVQFLQHSKKYVAARISFVTVPFFQFFLFCNFIQPGELIEFFYLLLPLFALLFLDNKVLIFLYLGLSIFLFLVPPFYFEIYEADRFPHIYTFPILFIGSFLTVFYFKNANAKNERSLAEEKLKVEQDKAQIEHQSIEIKQLYEFQNHFFVNIAHELRTPLTLIKGHAINAQKLSINNEVKEKIHAVIDNSSKIEGLINDIIDVTKAENQSLKLSLKTTSVNRLIEHQFNQFKSLFTTKDINFNLSLLDIDHTIKVDLLYFERVLGNILTNAIKYTKSKGAVKITANIKDGYLTLNIIDSGIGLNVEDSIKIFNRFYQVDNDINKASGSGIGLAFCKEIIHVHNGEIFAKPNKNGGSTFTIKLKAQQQNILEPTTLNLTSTSKTTHKETILLAEDNHDMRAYIKSVLYNYNVIEATNGVEALEKLKENKVDIIVSDYMMPEMDGLELVQALKHKKNTTPIIIITARADSQSKLDILELGIDDYLTKPFIEEELLFRLKHSLINSKSRLDIHIDDPEEKASTTNNLVTLAKTIIEKNIDNTFFGVPDLVLELNMSEKTFGRKIKPLTGLTPNQFIREVKLIYVRLLIENNSCQTLAELANKVGMKNTSHLQKIYLERFGTQISLK
jgi:signal transduction histidine kinase/DNA-binding response OmpR family regulator